MKSDDVKRTIEEMSTNKMNKHERSIDEIIEQAIQGHASTRDAIRWAMQQEREACAQVCEDLIGTRAMARHCADAIIARGAPVHASDISQERVDETTKDRHISYVCPNCHWSLNRQEPDTDIYDVWVEQETCQQNRQVAMRKTTRDEKIVNPGVYETAKSEHEPWVKSYSGGKPNYTTPEECEWVGLDHEMMRNTSLEFNRGALWAERWLKEKNDV